MSAEMPLSEGAAGAGLEVFFESHRAWFISELNRDQELPGAVLGRVTRESFIVPG